MLARTFAGQRDIEQEGIPLLLDYAIRPPDYLIAFNIGAIWNVIFKWVERGMEESLDNVRGTLETYLRRVSQGL